MNHISRGTQFLGTVGLYRTANADSCEIQDRIGFAAHFDQFTDTRGNDLYLSQFRLQIGTPISPNWSVGLRYTEPVSEDVNPIFFTDSSLTGNFEVSQTFAGFLSGYWSDNLLTFMVGHREHPNSTFIDAAARRPLGGNLYVFVDALNDFDDVSPGVEQAVDHRQQDHQVGSQQIGGVGCDDIVVAETNLVDGNGVIFVDDRNRV